MKNVALVFYFLVVLSTSLFSQIYQWDWVEKIEGNGTQNITALHCGNGKVFHAGTFQETVEIGVDPYIAEGVSDAFLCVYNDSNVLIKKIIFHGNGVESIGSVLTDNSGNFWLIGETSDTLKFDNNVLPNTSGNTVFILKFDQNFMLVSSKMNSGPASAYVSGLVATWNHENSRIVISGNVSGDNVFFDGTEIASNTVFTASYNPGSNQFEWASQFNCDASVKDIVICDSGYIYLSGSFHQIYIPSQGLSMNASSGADGFLMKCDTSGNLLWVSRIGGYYDEQLSSIEFTDNQNVVVTGYISTTGTIVSSYNWLLDTITPYGPYNMGDMVLAKYSPAGEVIQVKTAGGNNSDKGYDIGKDQNGLLYISGSVVWSYQDSIWFDSIGFLHYGGHVPFVAIYDQDLNPLHVFYSQYCDHTEAQKLAILNDSSIYTSGTFCGESTFSDIIIQSSDLCPGSWDVSDVFISHIRKANMFGRIQGTLYLSGSPLEYMVSLFQKTGPSDASFIMKKWADYQGHYYFDVYSPGEYFVRGETYDHCPTYYLKEYLWTEAEVFDIQSDTVIDNIDIHLFVNQNLGGNNEISGTVYSQDSIPLQWIRLILTDTIGSFIAMEYSDSIGFYKFVNIPAGTYNLLADTSGINISSYYTITINDAKASYSDYDFIMCMNSMICTLGEVGIAKPALQLNCVFPNPASNFFVINAENIIPESISLYSIDGKEIPISVHARDHQCQVTLTKDVSGLCLLKFKTYHDEFVSRMVLIQQ